MISAESDAAGGQAAAQLLSARRQGSDDGADARQGQSLLQIAYVAPRTGDQGRGLAGEFGDEGPLALYEQPFFVAIAAPAGFDPHLLYSVGVFIRFVVPQVHVSSFSVICDTVKKLRELRP